MKKYILFLLLIPHYLFGQSDSLYPKKYFYAELLGNGAFYSLNYEKVFYEFSPKKSLAYRIGTGLLPYWALAYSGGQWEYRSDWSKPFYNLVSEMILINHKRKARYDDLAVGYSFLNTHFENTTIQNLENRQLHLLILRYGIGRRSKKGLFIRGSILLAYRMYERLAAPMPINYSTYHKDNPWAFFIGFSVGKAF